MDVGTVTVGGLLQPRLDIATVDGAPSFAIDRARVDVWARHPPVDGSPALMERVIVEFIPTPKLLDAWVEVGRNPVALRVGQQKVPTSRGNMVIDPKAMLPWGTIAGGFLSKREIGATLMIGPADNSGTYDIQVGVYDGEGQNIVGNGNKHLMYVVRAAWSPTGSPIGPYTELIHDAPDLHDPIFTIGAAVHHDNAGPVGNRVFGEGVAIDLFWHERAVTGQAEAMVRHVQTEAAPAATYAQEAASVQMGAFLPGAWARDHLALLWRVEYGDPYDGIPPVIDDTHPAPEPASVREMIAVGLYLGKPFADPQDARVMVGYRAAQETEGAGIDNDQLSIAANLAF